MRDYKVPVSQCVHTAALLFSLLAADARAQSVWNLGTLEAGSSHRTSIEARNASCKGKHDFTITIRDAPWLTLAGPATLRGIPMGASKTAEVVVDLRRMEPGTYSGQVVVQCADCPPPPRCTQDVKAFEVRVQVAPARANRYPGEVAFEGLFFGHGPVAKKLPEIWGDGDLKKLMPKGADPTRIDQLRNRVIGRMKAGDPGFFDKFGSDIQSGNHLRIERTLDNACEQLTRSLSDEVGFDVRARYFDQNPGGAEPGIGVFVWVIWNTAVAWEIAAVVEVAAVEVVAVVHFGVKFWGISSADPASRLEREMFVDLIARRLGPGASGSDSTRTESDDATQ